MPLVLIIFLVSLAESVVSFVGGFVAILNTEKIKSTAHFVVSFAVGAMLGVALLEIIPEAIAASSADAILPWVLAGVILFFVLEKFLFWYHCHGKECPVHTYTYLILWGDFLHNFVDGVIIALAFMVDTKLGLMTSLAVILHEIPQEVGDFGILMHGGFSKSRALLFNFLVSLSTVVGALVTYALGSALEPFLPFALALIAGNFIYLAATDLMPELHESTGFWHGVLQTVFIILGALLVTLPEFIL